MANNQNMSGCDLSQKEFDSLGDDDLLVCKTTGKLCFFDSYAIGCRSIYTSASDTRKIFDDDYFWNAIPIENLRWPTVDEYNIETQYVFLRGEKDKKIGEKMQQTSGQKLSVNDFNSLKKGDVYFVLDQLEMRAFERFAKCCKFKKKPHNKAVNSDGKVNAIENMRWPTKLELDHYSMGSSQKYSLNRCESVACKGACGFPYQQPQKVVMPRSNNEKENSEMNNCNSAVSEALATVQADVKDAAWRTAAHETVKSVRAPLSAFLGKQKLPKGVCGAVMAMSDTDAGEAILAFLLGTSMRYVPKFCCDAKLTRLAKELRVLGLEHFTTKVADAFLEPLREQLVEVVSLLPFGDDDSGSKRK
jgi:hypothetical protein